MNRDRGREELRDALGLLWRQRLTALDELAALAWKAEQEGRAGLTDAEDEQRQELQRRVDEIDAEIERLDPRAAWGRGD